MACVSVTVDGVTYIREDLVAYINFKAGDRVAFRDDPEFKATVLWDSYHGDDKYCGVRYDPPCHQDVVVWGKRSFVYTGEPPVDLGDG